MARLRENNGVSITGSLFSIIIYSCLTVVEHVAKVIRMELQNVGVKFVKCVVNLRNILEPGNHISW